jgi:putative tryptophan/tyrosine transport system substrate-binding protein
VRRRVALNFTAGNLPTALAAKAAMHALSIVFMTGADPVKNGLVAKNLAICPSSNRLNSSSPSTSRPPKPSASPFRRTCSPSPDRVKRREFIAGLGATAWPLAAHAQQGDRVRRTGVLLSLDEDDPGAKGIVSAFTQALADLGWTDGRNVRTDLRWYGGDTNRIRWLAQELVGFQPDIIFVQGTPATVALQRETRTTPIVFLNSGDPVASGIVENRPGGNITGFAALEPSPVGKWFELLSEIAPGLKRAAIMFSPDTAPVSVYMPSFETAARSLKVVPIAAPVHNDVEIETAIIGLGREPRGGLVVMSDVFTDLHRVPIILAAARNNVPAVYDLSTFARNGGLLSDSIDAADIVRHATSYVHRILRGAKPAELPVQLPTKFEMVVNLKTAKALGLAVPPSILLRADEVIE